MNVAVGRKTPRDFLPALSLIARPVDVRTEVGQLMAIDRRVRLGLICVRAFNAGNPTPIRDRRRRHVLPVFSVVHRQVYETVVSANPDQVGVEWRRANGIDDAAFAVPIRVLG